MAESVVKNATPEQIDHIHEVDAHDPEAQASAENALEGAIDMAALDAELAAIPAAVANEPRKKGAVTRLVIVSNPYVKAVALKIRTDWTRKDTLRIDDETPYAAFLAKYGSEWNEATRDDLANALRAEFKAAGLNVYTSQNNTSYTPVGSVIVNTIKTNRKTATGVEKLPIIYLRP